MTKAIEKSFMMGESTDSMSRLDTYANIKKACLTANREEARFGEFSAMAFLVCVEN